MADREGMRKLEDQLNCSVCLDIYTDPKLLQCNHVFCRGCLGKLVDRDQQEQYFLTCPTCRRVTPLPAGGVANLQPAFQINHLLAILHEHRKAKEATPCCTEHQDRVLELYCETCEQLICVQCTIQEHNGHSYNLIGEVFEKHKREIMSSLHPAEVQLAFVRNAREEIDQRYRELFDQQATLEAEIHKSVLQLHMVIEMRKNELLDKLHRITQDKLNSLASQRYQIETGLAQLSSYLDFIKEELGAGSQEEVLKMKTAIAREVRELTSAFQPDTLKPNTEADMKFLASSSDITTLCQNHGQVFTPTSPCPSKCLASGRGVEMAVLGEEPTTALLQVNNFLGQPLEGSIQAQWQCELVSQITGTRARGTVEKREQSQYEISYHPTTKGRHQLHVTVEGQHIRGSPFSVVVKSPVERLGTPILRTRIGVEEPCGVVLNQQGEVVVSERTGHRVSVFSPSGEKLRSFGSHGIGMGQLSNPRGLAVDGKGNIFVVDDNNHRIQKFTGEGQFLTAVGTRVSGPHHFDNFQSITFNANNNHIYAVNGCRVQVLDSDLNCCHAFGRSGDGRGQFNYPWGIACDSTGNVYVADSANHRIQVFTAKGRFLHMFGRRGQNAGELYWPYGIAMDTADTVYVSEFYNHRISVFTSQGHFVVSFGRFGENPGEFNYPYALAVDVSGVLYMCDYGNNRVQIF